VGQESSASCTKAELSDPNCTGHLTTFNRAAHVRSQQNRSALYRNLFLDRSSTEDILLGAQPPLLSPGGVKWRPISSIPFCLPVPHVGFPWPSLEQVNPQAGNLLGMDRCVRTVATAVRYATARQAQQSAAMWTSGNALRKQARVKLTLPRSECSLSRKRNRTDSSRNERASYCSRLKCNSLNTAFRRFATDNW
jgi:hypothetical protein